MKPLPSDTLISCFYDSTTDCVKVIDKNHRIMSFNPHGLKVMEIDDVNDVLGKDWLAFWQGDMKPKAEAALKQANAGKSAAFEGYCPTFKGTMKYWEVTITPLMDDFGYVSWLLVVSRDVSDRLELEKTVAAQNKELAELRSQLKLLAR